MAGASFPTADFILSMMNPYKLGTTADSAKAGIAAGSEAANIRDRQKGMAQQKELALADDARAGQYLDLQKQGQAFNQKQDLNDRRMKAYGGFQSAVDAGDTEGADLAANALRMLGVDVQQYGGEQQGPAAEPVKAPLTQASPSAAVAQAQAQRAPMSAKDAQTDKQLDQLARSATVDSGDPMQAVAAASVPRPAPARAEVTAPEPEASGPRPGPARSQYIKGDEPAPAGEATPKQSLIRGYRLNFDGQTVDIDPQSTAERQRQRVASSLTPLLQNASTPEEQRAATTAIQAAVASVGTLTPDKAIEYGVGLYKDPLDRGGKEKRARIVGGGGAGPKEGYGGVPGLTKEGKQRSLETGRYARSVIKDSLTRYNVKGIRDDIAMGEDAISKAKSPDALAQFSSKATLQKMLMKGSLSDRDVSRLESAPGQWARLEQLVNNWTEGGQLPPEVIRQIVGIATAKNKLNRERLHSAGQAARDDIMSDETLHDVATTDEIEGWGNTAYGTTTGEFKKPEGKTRSALGASQGAPKPGAKPGAPSAPQPKNSAQARADALKKRLIGK